MTIKSRYTDNELADVLMYLSEFAKKQHDYLEEIQKAQGASSEAINWAQAIEECSSVKRLCEILADKAYWGELLE